MIPPFTPEGLLPPGPHDQPYRCTADEVKNRFVIARGSPAWRLRLFSGWELLRRGVADFVPSATWWLWGCFVSAHEEPLFGDAESLPAVVILPVADLPTEAHRIAMLVGSLRNAEEQHGVDVRIVWAFPPDHPNYLIDTVHALEWRWREQARQGVADHATMELVPAGFLEVGP